MDKRTGGKNGDITDGRTDGHSIKMGTDGLTDGKLFSKVGFWRLKYGRCRPTDSWRKRSRLRRCVKKAGINLAQS